MQIAQLPNGSEVVYYGRPDMRHCPFCGVLALVPLTPRQLKQQPDDTTHVCHPALGGCNHGFAEGR